MRFTDAVTGNSVETVVETDERNMNVVVLYVNGEFVDDEFVSVGNATCDMENVAEVEGVLFERNGVTL